MFSKQPGYSLADLTIDLRDECDWSVDTLKTFEIPLDITALAFEPVSRLLVIGTSHGVIYIFGHLGVECKVDLPQPAEVRFLQISTSTFNLVCLDGENRLNVCSLSNPGKPKFVATAKYDQVNSIHLSPSHSHLFLAMKDGSVKTFDMLCLRKSPFSIPNLWKLYEDDMVSKGVPSFLAPDLSTIDAVDIVIHPRNLDLVFVAYAGGIALTNLTQRSIICAYELIFAPGAPGGCGYNSNKILTHRRPMVTCLSVHPSGHFFAAGYDDGSIAFWATDDDTKPLLVRTLNTLDVDLIDAQTLDTLLSKSDMLNDSVPNLPEPIFKLSWSGFSNSSDPRGGETTLTILGGLTSDELLGLTVFVLPPFNPSDPPPDGSAPNAGPIHPFFLEAMRESSISKKRFFYETDGVVQDYLLLSHNTPHFSGNFDPYAILLITDVNALRTTGAYQFPPAGLLESMYIQTEQEVESKLRPSEQVPSMLPTLLTPSYAVPLRTPFSISVGHSRFVGGHLFQLSNDAYKSFIAKSPLDRLSLELKAGHAYTETTHELKLLTYHPRRLFVTWNKDLTVRFFDFSAQLLLPSAAASSLLDHDWPETVPALTIDLRDIFKDTKATELLMTTVENATITSVNFASQAMELALTLKSGEVIVYHSTETHSNLAFPVASISADIVLLNNIEPPLGSRLTPYFLVVADKGPVSTCALSDIGFLAISYQSGALIVVDMRGPKVIFTSQTSNKKNRYSARSRIYGSNEDSELDVIRTMTWTISGLQTDLSYGVRLITIRLSGDVEVYSMIYSANPSTWRISDEPAKFKSVPDPIRNAAFVLDMKTGCPLQADRDRLSTFLQSVGHQNSPSEQCFLVVVGVKGARSFMNVTGERLNKVEWSHKYGNAESAQIVEHMGSRALVVQTDKLDSLVYSLPHLEYICTLKLPPASVLTMDPNGDYIAHVKSGAVHNFVYGSLFSVRRTYMPPDIDLTTTHVAVPPQPQPVSIGPASLLRGWLSYNKTLTGDNVDTLLGGPDRPIPQKIISAPESQAAETAGRSTATFAAQASAVQSNIYNRLTSAMGERGQLLGDLEERFNSLEQGSRNMVAQAKRLAAQQTAKSWFGL